MLAILVASGHHGVTPSRSAPELSDVALFVCACAAIWLVRRQLRRRLPRD